MSAATSASGWRESRFDALAASFRDAQLPRMVAMYQCLDSLMQAKPQQLHDWIDEMLDVWDQDKAFSIAFNQAVALDPAFADRPKTCPACVQISFDAQHSGHFFSGRIARLLRDLAQLQPERDLLAYCYVRIDKTLAQQRPTKRLWRRGCRILRDFKEFTTLRRRRI